MPRLPRPNQGTRLPDMSASVWPAQPTCVRGHLTLGVKALETLNLLTYPVTSGVFSEIMHAVLRIDVCNAWRRPADRRISQT